MVIVIALPAIEGKNDGSLTSSCEPTNDYEDDQKYTGQSYDLQRRKE